MDIILPYLHLDIFHLECGPKLAFFDQLPSSPCPRSFWMTLNLKTTHHSNLHKNWFGIFVGLKCYDKILIHFIWSKPIDHAWTDNLTCISSVKYATFLPSPGKHKHSALRVDKNLPNLSFRNLNIHIFA